MTSATSWAQTISEQDSLALVALYEQLDGENWNEQSGWLDDPVSQWYGIALEEFDDEWRVTGIQLSNNNLNGDGVSWFDRLYTESIEVLQYLKQLDLSGNQISNDPEYITENLSGVTNLQYLEEVKLSGNRDLYGVALLFSESPDLNTFWFEETHIYEIDFGSYFEWVEGVDDVRPSGLVDGSPPAPRLTQPANHGSSVPQPVMFRWQELIAHPHMVPMQPAETFRVQLADDDQFEQVLADTIVDGLSVTIDVSLESEQEYFWRVQAQNETGPGIWSHTFQFQPMDDMDLTVIEKTWDGSSVAGLSMIGDNWLYSFNKNGAPMWNTATGGAVSTTPVVDELSGLVIAGIENRNVLALDRYIGSTVWSFFADAPVRKSPVVSADRIMLVVSSDGTIYGFDLESEEDPPQIWEYSLDDTVTAGLSLGVPGVAYAVTGQNLIQLFFDHQGMVEGWSQEFDEGLSSSPVIDAYNRLYLADENGILYSLDGETGEELWQVMLQNPVVSTAALGDGKVFVVDSQGEVYAVDQNDGTIDWQFSFTENPSESILYANGAVYIGSESGPVIRVQIPESVEKEQGQATVSAVAHSPLWATDKGNNRRTGVQSSDNLITSIDEPGRAEIPEKLSLRQNYPNPFNPVTVIRYDLPEAGEVTLEVFDMLGRRVDVLVNRHQDPGTHRISWDASHLSSGVYLYRLNIGDEVLSRRMTLIK
ncbi:PQQ-binding-like beta-propeller repeat protein [Balneolales bacterium ANBcel1]|nr:PQQ-binding-like beta-propeller repeat protein [Balneolales bacterium ANBcel1]